MMQPTKDCKRPDGSTFGELLGLGRNRDPLADPLVRTAGVVVAERVRAQEMLEVAPSENDDVVETLSPGTAKQPGEALARIRAAMGLT
jgi:hypothetical protein